MKFHPCPCTRTLQPHSPQHHLQDDPQSSNSHDQTINYDHSLSSLPSLPSIPSLTSSSHNNSQPPSTTTNHHYITTFKSHTSSISSLALIGKHLLSASSDGQIRISTPSSQSPPLPIFSGESSVKSMVVHGDKIFTGHQDHKIRVHKLDNKQQTIKLIATLPTLNDRLTKLVFAKNYIKIRRHQRRTWVHHVDAVSALALSKDGEFLYSGSWDRSFKVWRTTDFKCLESVWNSHDDAVNAVVVSHDGYVYTASADRKIKVWKKDGGDKKHKLVDTLEKHKSAVNALALSTDGNILYSGACDRSIIVWEKSVAGDGVHMVVAGAVRGHSKAILCIAVVGDVVISGSADKTIRVWRRGIDGKSYLCLGVLEGHKSPIKCLAAAVEEGCSSAGGSGTSTSYLVFGGSLDCEIKMWKLWVPFL